MDWYRVLHSPPIMDSNWFKDVRVPSLVEVESNRFPINRTVINRSTVEVHLVYDCANCSRPVFTNFLGKVTVNGEFVAGVVEEFFKFRMSFQVVGSTETFLFNDNMLCVVSCQCNEELGYLILFSVAPRMLAPRMSQSTFWVRSEKIKARAFSRDMKIMEFVDNLARSTLSQLQKKRLSSGAIKPILTPGFMAAAGDAAFKVVNHVLAGFKANCAEAPLQVLAEKRLRDIQPIVPAPEESDNSHWLLSPCREKKYKVNLYREDEDCEYWDPLLEFLLFEEILPRLPVESLLRFKLVSKKWLHYITTDSHFIYNHLCRQSQTTKLSIICGYRMGLLDGHISSKVQIRDVSLYMERFSGYSFGYKLIGSCNGLVCLRMSAVGLSHPLVTYQSQEDAIVLWNPETREGRDVLLPPLEPGFYQSLEPPYRRRSIYDHPVFGFGFDANHNDYKIVRVVPTQPALLDFDVFTRNSGCWRRLDKGLPGYTVYMESRDSVLLNGCLYWLVLAVESSSAKRRCILSFDLRDERFRIIDVLEHLNYLMVDRFLRRLVKWKHSFLAYLSLPEDQPGNRKEIRFELILDSDGNSVANQNATPSVRFYESNWSFCGVSHDRFFMADHVTPRTSLTYHAHVLMYDPFSSEYESIGFQRVLTGWDWSTYAYGCLRVLEYVPSLVSVYPDQKTMKECKKRMEVRYWVDLFWRVLGLTKQQFGLTREAIFLERV